jgi:hypothetical protein
MGRLYVRHMSPRTPRTSGLVIDGEQEATCFEHLSTHARSSSILLAFEPTWSWNWQAHAMYVSSRFSRTSEVFKDDGIFV